jgi:hypothetical protein
LIPIVGNRRRFTPLKPRLFLHGGRLVENYLERARKVGEDFLQRNACPKVCDFWRIV